MARAIRIDRKLNATAVIDVPTVLWHYDDNHHNPHTTRDELTPWECHQREKEDQILNSVH